MNTYTVIGLFSLCATALAEPMEETIWVKYRAQSADDAANGSSMWWEFDITPAKVPRGHTKTDTKTVKCEKMKPVAPYVIQMVKVEGGWGGEPVHEKARKSAHMRVFSNTDEDDMHIQCIIAVGFREFKWMVFIQDHEGVYTAHVNEEGLSTGAWYHDKNNEKNEYKKFTCYDENVTRIFRMRVAVDQAALGHPECGYKPEDEKPVTEDQMECLLTLFTAIARIISLPFKKMLNVEAQWEVVIPEISMLKREGTSANRMPEKATSILDAHWGQGEGSSSWEKCGLTPDERLNQLKKWALESTMLVSDSQHELTVLLTGCLISSKNGYTESAVSNNRKYNYLFVYLVGVDNPKNLKLRNDIQSVFYTFRTAKTFAHELGHVLGLDHPFDYKTIRERCEKARKKGNSLLVRPRSDCDLAKSEELSRWVKLWRKCPYICAGEWEQEDGGIMGYNGGVLHDGKFQFTLGSVPGNTGNHGHDFDRRLCKVFEKVKDGNPAIKQEWCRMFTRKTDEN